MAVFKEVLFTLTLCAFPLGVQAADIAANWSDLLTRSKPETQAEWGARYEHGEGVDQDYTRALYLYCAAASKGYAPAQYQLGWMYTHGRGVEQDDSQAAAWFRLAAAQGIVQAKNMLALVGGESQNTKPLCVLPRRGPEPGLTRPIMISSISSEERRQVEKIVQRLAPKYGLDPLLVLAVVQVESAFQAQAVSAKNAQGLMQLIPETADRFGVQDSMDPLQNLQGGMAYLRWLLAFFQGDVQLALAGYNAGENTVVKYRGVPPYPETRAYVEKIIQLYGTRMHPPVAPVAKPAAMLSSPAYMAVLKKDEEVLLKGGKIARVPGDGQQLVSGDVRSPAVPLLVKVR